MAEIRRNDDGGIDFYDDNGKLMKHDDIYNDGENNDDIMLKREMLPMCRCMIINPEDKYFTYCTHWFTWQYEEECENSNIWIN